MAIALYPYERRVNVLSDCLHPPVPWLVLRLIQIPARATVDARGCYSAVDDGDSVHGLRATLGADELLGRHRHHQPILGDPACWRFDRDAAVGRLHGRQPDADPVLLAALSAAVRDRRGRLPAFDGAAPARLEQSARHRPARPPGLDP